ncbi:hypothetical protein Hanom_Chr05g00392921 [Helianthus anomalus]
MTMHEPYSCYTQIIVIYLIKVVFLWQLLHTDNSYISYISCLFMATSLKPRQPGGA